MRRFVVLLLPILGGLSWSVLPALPAAADCSSPQISVTPRAVRPGEPILVAGRAFGTDCRDTGPPDERPLGDPQRDVALYVDQAGSRHLIAVVSADDEYQFAVASFVPVELPEGAANVVAVSSDSGGWFPETSAPLAIAGTPVRSEDPPAITGDADDSAHGGETPEDGWFSPLSFLTGAAVATLVAAGLLRWRRRPARKA